MPTNGTLLFRDHVERTPDRPAFIFDADGSRLSVSFAEHFDAMNRVAAGLLAAGLNVGDRVLVSALPSPAMLHAVYGVVRAGLTAVLCDPALPPAAADAFVEHAGCAASVIDLEGGVPASVLSRGEGATFTVGGGARPFEDLLSTAPRDEPDTAVPARHPAVIFSSSGSTGRPKLITKTHEHFHLLDRYRHPAFTAFDPGDGPTAEEDEASIDIRYLIATSLYHTGGMNAGVMLGLLRGWTGVHAGPFNAARMLTKLALHRCSTVLFTPSQAAACLHERDLLQVLDLSALSSLRVASGPSSPELLNRLQAAFPDTEILNIYALTECAPCLGQIPGGPRQPRASCGRPLPGVEGKVVDESGRPANDGELWIKSELISEGTILEDTVARDRVIEGWYRTGDVFHIDEDGWFYFVGRVDDMFVCGGENVHPADIERLLATHADVVEACVVGLPADVLGAVPAAFVVGSARITGAELVTFMQSQVAAHLVPHRIEIVPALPTIGPGKVDRRRVRAELLGDAASPPPVVARSGLHDQVLAAWKEILGLEHVDPAASFMDAGGTSLGAVELITRLRSVDIEISVADLLQASGPHELAQRAQRVAGSASARTA